MPLEKQPRRLSRPNSVALRLSDVAIKQLRLLAERYNQSQADVVEHILAEAYDHARARSPDEFPDIKEGVPVKPKKPR